MDKNIKTGLVLEGGGMRGIYTSGVLDEMLLNGIKVDGLVGVSAGIIHGISYVSEQFARNIRYFVKYRSDKRFMSFSSLFKTGDVCDEQFCYHDIPDELYPLDYETFNKNAAKKIEVYSTASNLETGKAEYLRITDLQNQMDAVRASASLPIVSRIVEYDGKKYLDGGSTDSIPLKAMQDMGFEKNIVVLTRPYGYVKKPDRSMPLMKKIYGDYPDYLQACRERHLMYNEELLYIERCKLQGKTFVIQPSRTIKIARSEKSIDKIKKMYKLGRFDAMNQMEEIKRFLEEGSK